jgi:hypothetical protein
MSGSVPLIDRKEERARFKKILAEQSARLVTIKDKPGNGKSRLLQEFNTACGWEKIPSSLTVVSIGEIRTPFDLVGRIIGAFGSGPFQRFRALDKERVNKNFDAFTSPVAGSVHVGGSIGGTAVVAQQIGVVAQEGAHVHMGPKEWSDEHERIAAAECVDLFFEELHELALDKPVVILLDEFEGCSVDTVRDWIVNDLLPDHVFNDEHESKLIVVIAGRDVPDLRERLGARHDELVDVIPRLSRWCRDDIVEFLTAVTGREPEPEEVDIIEMWLEKRDATIEVIVNTVTAWPG